MKIFVVFSYTTIALVWQFLPISFGVQILIS